MRKLLILVLVSITAFLGVNLTKVSTYAATTPGITYVTEGNRVYVHLGSATDSLTHVTSNNHADLTSAGFTEETNIYMDKPANAIDFIVLDETMQRILPDGEYGDMNNMYFVISSIANGGVIVQISNYDDDSHMTVIDSVDSFIMYFEISIPIKASDAELLIENDRAYLAFNGNKLIDTTNLDPTNSNLRIDIPENATNLIIADHTGSIRYNWNNTGIDSENPAITGYDTIFIVTSAGDFWVDVEGELPPYEDVILTNYEEGLYPWGLNSMPKFYIYFELLPFEDSEPIISGDVLPVNIDNPLPETTLRDEISAWDDIDGDITDQLVYEGGTYEAARLAGTLQVGQTYTIIYSVEDSSGNVTTATINVMPIDIEKPTFGITNTTTTVGYDDLLDVNAFKANLLATDNYDDAEDIVINILENTYLDNNTTIGTYTVVYRAIDSSANYRDIYITINVVDDVPPVITGPNTFDTPLSPKTPLATMLAQFTATDAKSGNVTDSIEVITDNYSAATTAGVYSVTIRFSDDAGNQVTKTFSISMVDGLPPVLYITNNMLMALNQFQTLTVEQLIAWLETQGTLTGFTVLSNSLEGNEDTPGTYAIVMSYTLNGVQKTTNLSILVTPAEALKWTVSFITNGGSTLAAVLVDNLGQLLVQAPTRPGYRFIGWYKDAEFTQPFSVVTGRISSDTTLYAKWAPTSTGAPSVIIDNLSNLKFADIALIVTAVAVSIGIGFAFSNNKKPKRKRG